MSVSTLSDMSRVFAKIGCLSFGGPAAQIALMHKEIVDDHKWLSEQQFLNALSFCMLLPGPEAMQLATYAGWRLHGVLGGLIAGLLFVIPGAVVIIGLASLYAIWGNVPLVEALFFGIKAVVLVIVLEALIKVSKKALKRLDYWIIAGLAFIGIFFFAIPFPVIIICAALYGFTPFKQQGGNDAVVLANISLNQTLKTIFIWLSVWLCPLVVLWFIAGEGFLTDLGLFFSKLAVVTFGGAYAVLAYMAQDVVNHFGWLTAGEMMDGLGLAETTPGPLILVTEFVGFLAGFKESGFWFALLAALITLWATFAPCFLWIFTGAPYVEWITAQPRLSGALIAITAAVVGVILNLSLWFALHVLFKNVTHETIGYMHLWVPQFASIDWLAIGFFMFSAVLAFGFRWSVLPLLALSSVSAVIVSFVLPI